ncbi:MAG: signal peptidase II [Candidatus Nanopelagicales bacterium]
MSDQVSVSDSGQMSKTWQGIPYVAITFGLAVVVLFLDQIGKLIAVTFLEGRPPIQIVGQFLQLNFIRNPGAAFSIGTGMTIVFSLVACAVVIVIVRSARKLGSLGWALALGGLLGGALGNLTDRIFRSPGIFRGHVVDYIQMPPFGIFNVADIAITFSAIGIVILAVRGIHLDGTRGGTNE